ncbi:MAG: hypothetical protein KAJ53_11555 [Anaerolineales bacterium]|nr:hypothetical protein [Anaerolineales bacterium]
METSWLMRKFLILCITIVIILLIGCNIPRGQGAVTPTLNVTQAYQTIEARLTQASELTATLSPPISTDSGIVSPKASATATTPASTATPTPLCNMAAPGIPIDITIPDDTLLDPSRIFTKIWRLKNIGTCTWTRSYAAAFFSGDQMGAPIAVSLAGNVAPGQSVDIAIDMTAPQSAGKFQGNWKLRNDANVLFGIGPNGSSSFWVRIKVEHTPTPTSTPIIPTPTATATATPIVEISGNAMLTLNDTLDLDTNQVNTGGGEDLKYALSEDGQHKLSPLGSTIMGIFGQVQPKLADCQTVNMDGSPVIVDTIPIGNYLCYQTGAGRPGWAKLVELNNEDDTLTVNILTWASQAE